MYMDKLDGRITAGFFDQRSAIFRQEQERIVRRINTVQSSATAPLDEAIDALQLTSEASRPFERQKYLGAARILGLLVKKSGLAGWKGCRQRGSSRSRFFSIRIKKVDENKGT
jgi:hypothetical protein